MREAPSIRADPVDGERLDRAGRLGATGLPVARLRRAQKPKYSQPMTNDGATLANGCGAPASPCSAAIGVVSRSTTNSGA